MTRRWTTICCSAVALIALSPRVLDAQAAASRPVIQTHADKTPLSLFPLTPVWTLALNNALTAAPAFDATRAFFPIEGDRIVAYNLVSGQQLWIVSVATRFEPATGDGLLFVAEPQALTALHGEDGRVAWKLPFDEGLAVPLVWDHGWLVATTTGGDILAFRAADGQLIWRRNIGAAPHARPALAADRVYIPTEDARVVALRVDTGEPLWSRRLGAAANNVLAEEERLYVGSNDRHLYCLGADDGAIRWRWRTGASVIGKPVADERTVFFVSLDNVLRALNRSSGVQRWKTALPLRPSSGPLKAADTIIVSGPSPSVRGYQAGDGKPAGDLATAGELAARPHLFMDPSRPLPVVLITTRDILKGATVTALTRLVEPSSTPVAPLPGPVSAVSPVVTPESIAVQPTTEEP